MKKAILVLAVILMMPVAYVFGPLFLPNCVSDYIYLSSSTRQELYAKLEHNRIARLAEQK